MIQHAAHARCRHALHALTATPTRSRPWLTGEARHRIECSMTESAFQCNGVLRQPADQTFVVERQQPRLSLRALLSLLGALRSLSLRRGRCCRSLSLLPAFLLFVA